MTLSNNKFIKFTTDSNPKKNINFNKYFNFSLKHFNNINIFFRNKKQIKENYIVNKFTNCLNEKNILLLSREIQDLTSKDIIQGLKRIELIFENSNITTDIASIKNFINLDFKLFSLKLNFFQSNFKENIDKNILNQTIVKAFNELDVNKINPSFFSLFLLEYYLQKFNLLESLKTVTIIMKQLLSLSLQSVYEANGIKINLINFEIITKKMFSTIKVIDITNSIFKFGEIVSLDLFEVLFNVLKNSYKSCLDLLPMVLIQNKSFSKLTLFHGDLLSNISFQDTKRLIIEYSLKKNKDWLSSLKSNLFSADTIPTGSNIYKNK